MAFFPGVSGDYIDRNSLLGDLSSGSVGGAFGASTGGSVWGSLINGGLGILNTYLQSKLNPTAPPPVISTPVMQSGMGFQSGAIVPVLTGAAEAAGATMTRAGVLSALRALGAKIAGNIARVAPEVWAAIPSAIKQAAAALGISIIADELVSGMRGSSSSGHRRRMNYLNPRAARRAITRIKGVRKTLHKIEKQLPVRTVHAKAHGKRR